MFYKSYIVYYNVYHDYIVFIEMHVYTKYNIFALGYCVSLCDNIWNITEVDLNILGQGINLLTIVVVILTT